MLDIRPPTEDDRVAMARVAGFSFNYHPRPENLTLGGRLCAFDGPVLAGTCGTIPFDQWFGGRRARCAGVASVAVAAEYRGQGVGTQLMKALMRRDRDEGYAVSTLFPANAPLYRKLGYEFGGLRPQHVVSIGDLPGGKLEGVREASAADVPTLMACYSRFCAVHNGPVESADPQYFTNRMLAFDAEGVHQRTVMVEGTDGAEGYASYFTGPSQEGGYRITCKHFMPCTPAALHALLAYFAHFENSAKELAWYGASGYPFMSLALSSNAFTVDSDVHRWMTRALNVPAALEARGYPQVSGRARLAIDDPLFPDNNGPWLLEADNGRARVTRADEADVHLSIGALSALYTGYAAPLDLVLVGALAPSAPALDFLGRLFAGPLPWMPHFF